jgi:hypothetical protein
MNRLIPNHRLVPLAVAATLCLSVLPAAPGEEPVMKNLVPAAPFTDFELRSGLARSGRQFAQKKTARVAYMGGSVTTREWREGVQAYLARRFPDTKFDYVMAGLGGTPAQLGVFRLETDVFPKGQVDLLFLEFAVNGGSVREMEGIVRHARRLNPNLDIVLLYFARTDHVAEDDAGRTPAIVVDHEKVAAHYNLPTLFLYRTVARRIREGKMTWADFSPDNVHPTPAGCELYASCINTFLDAAWRLPGAAAPAPPPLPLPLDPLCLDRGRYIAPDTARDVKGFVRFKTWTPTQKTCNFSPPADVFAAETPGAELTLDFTGTIFGLLPIVGEDAGTIEYSLDGAPFVQRDLYSAAYGDQFQLPSPQLIFTDLPDGKHTIVLRVSEERHPKSKGHAVRILQFMAH